jgi:hypothetical protein
MLGMAGFFSKKDLHSPDEMIKVTTFSKLPGRGLLPVSDKGAKWRVKLQFFKQGTLVANG